MEEVIELDKIFMSPFKLSDLLLRPSEMVASLNLHSLHSSVRNWKLHRGCAIHGVNTVTELIVI